MDQEPQTTEPKSLTLSTVIIASVTTCLIAAVGLVIVYKSVNNRVSEIEYAQQGTLDKLNKRVNSLETQARELAARPIANNAPVEELRSGVVEAQNTIATLTERIAEIEKKPAPQPVETSKTPALLKAAVLSGTSYQTELNMWDKEHPKSEAAFPTLRTYASTGISAEPALRSSLRSLLKQQPNEKVQFPQESTVARINAHLSNFVSIKKKSPPAPELQQLRETVDTASLADLQAHVAALPETLKAPFAEWLKIANERNKALAELHQLDGAL